jgi:hypothetical protein
MMTFQMDAAVAHHMAAGPARAGVDRLVQAYEDGVRELLERWQGKPLVDVEPEVQRVLEGIGACADAASVHQAAWTIQHGRPFDVTVRLVERAHSG